MRYVARVEGTWFGPLSEKDADYLRKNAPPGSPTRFWLRQLAPPTFLPEGRGWIVLMINDKLPTDAVGPLGSKQDAEGEEEARSHGVLHGSVSPLRPREELPGLP
jgi:hypothetical protein